eukprot:1190695-Prorocentrum_minimum.AAC.3
MPQLDRGSEMGTSRVAEMLLVGGKIQKHLQLICSRYAAGRLTTHISFSCHANYVAHAPVTETPDVPKTAELQLFGSMFLIYGAS